MRSRGLYGLIKENKDKASRLNYLIRNTTFNNTLKNYNTIIKIMDPIILYSFLYSEKD